MKRSSTEGSYSERLRLHRRAKRSGALIQWPYRLPHGRGDRPSTRFHFGEGSWVGPGAWLNLNAPEGSFRVGSGTVIGPDLTIGAGGLVEVEDGCLFSARCVLLDRLHDYEDWILPAMREGRTPHFNWALTDPQPVRIGAGSWLGIGVVVLPGVTIGEGCVIGAGSVVSRDVPPYSIAAGVPARVLRAIDPDDARGAVEDLRGPRP